MTEKENQLSHIEYSDPTNKEKINEIEIELGFPPSVNKLYMRGRKGQVILTDEARKYREYVKQTINNNLMHCLDKFPTGPEIVYGLTLIFHIVHLENPGWFEFYSKGPMKGKRKAVDRFKIIDVDNRIKFIQDTLVKSVGVTNDSQIFTGHQKKVKSDKNEDYVTARLYVVDSKYFLDERWTGELV